jgi:hypothetical protein
MSGQAQILADQFEQINRDAIATIDRCTDADWQKTCANDERTVGTVAHHIAESHMAVAGLAQMAANGQPLPPLTREIIDQGNAKHAAEHTNCTKQETRELLQRNGVAAANIVRGLNDEQLARSGTLFGNPITSAQIIEGILIDHLRGHLNNLQATAGARSVGV